MRYAGHLSPRQAAAFWVVGALSADDMSRLAMQWLDQDISSGSIAILASEPKITMRDHGALFEKCLREAGAGLPSEREAAWLYIQTLLQAVATGFDPLDVVRDVLPIHYKGIELFAPRNLAGDGQPFAGEAIGFEQILGLYYTLDEPISRGQVEEVLRDLKMECARVLTTLYADPASLSAEGRLKMSISTPPMMSHEPAVIAVVVLPARGRRRKIMAR